MFSPGPFEYIALFGVTPHDPMTGEFLANLFRFFCRFF